MRQEFNLYLQPPMGCVLGCTTSSLNYSLCYPGRTRTYKPYGAAVKGQCNCPFCHGTLYLVNLNFLPGNYENWTFGTRYGTRTHTSGPMSCVLGVYTSPIITNRIVGVKDGARTRDLLNHNQAL